MKITTFPFLHTIVSIISKNLMNGPQETADLVAFTEEILNGKLHFLCSAWWIFFSNFVNTTPLYLIFLMTPFPALFNSFRKTYFSTFLQDVIYETICLGIVKFLNFTLMSHFSVWSWEKLPLYNEPIIRIFTKVKLVFRMFTNVFLNEQDFNEEVNEEEHIEKGEDKESLQKIMKRH